MRLESQELFLVFIEIKPLTDINLPIQPITKKTPFEESIEKLDLRGILTLISILSQRAFYLEAQKDIESKVIKPQKNLLHT